jgi:tRNA(Ile)-lysidine synthase
MMKPHARLLRAVADSLKRIGVRRDAMVLLALSGGPDSVALFHALLAMRDRFGFRIAAAHLNHQLRGAESDRDEAFVRELCSRCAVDLIVDHAEGLSLDTPNLEERAREARHAFLNAAADRLGADFIALAHQADDQAETVMMRLLRGAGASGLAAMAERGPDARIIRPMLSVTRDEVAAYLKDIGESFVNDSSNQSPAILRNRIRGELLPMLERNYAPGLRGRLTALASEMRAFDDFVATAAKRELESSASEDGLDISRFADLHPALQAELIRQYIGSAAGSLRRIERAHIEAIRHLCLDGPPNGSVDLPGLHLHREYATLRVSSGAATVPAPFVVRLEVGAVEIPASGFAFETRLVAPHGMRSPASKFEAVFDGSEAAGGLTVRNFRRGDKIAPFGMTGHRKIQDIFVDNKLSRRYRASYPILELNGAVAWVPGMVRGRVGIVTEASRSVLHVRALGIIR